MASIAPIRGEWPEVFIIIETTGRLDLGNVGRFLQRANTATRSLRPLDGPIPRAEIIELQSGSLTLRYAALSLMVASGALAFEVYQYFQNNEAAARAGRDLIQSDNATSITIIGGENTFELNSSDIPQLNRVLRQGAVSRGVARAPAPKELEMRGPSTGYAKRIDGEWWVELDRRRGMKLTLIDQRAEKEPFRENVRYRFEGDVFLGSDGEASGYSVYTAMPFE